MKLFFICFLMHKCFNKNDLFNLYHLKNEKNSDAALIPHKHMYPGQYIKKSQNITSFNLNASRIL